MLLKNALTKLVTKIGVSQGDSAIHTSCLIFLYEPKIPQELLKEKQK